jgi:hypothetical protein
MCGIVDIVDRRDRARGLARRAHESQQRGGPGGCGPGVKPGAGHTRRRLIAFLPITPRAVDEGIAETDGASTVGARLAVAA